MTGTSHHESSSRLDETYLKASSIYDSNEVHPPTFHQQLQGLQFQVDPTYHEALTHQTMQAHNLHQLSLHPDPSYLTTIQQWQTRLIGSTLDSLDGFGDPLPEDLNTRVVYRTSGMETMERFGASYGDPLRNLDVYEASFGDVYDDLQQRQYQQQASASDMTTMGYFEASLSECNPPFDHQHQYQLATPSQSQYPPTPTAYHNNPTSSTQTQPSLTSPECYLQQDKEYPTTMYPSYSSPTPLPTRPTLEQTLSGIGTQFPRSPQYQFQDAWVSTRKEDNGSQKV